MEVIGAGWGRTGTMSLKAAAEGCGYKACTDWPAAAFYKQLVELYPDAKVILFVRDPDKWYESMKETVWQMSQAMSNLPWYVSAVHKQLMPGRSNDMGCFPDDPHRAKELFKQHIQEVMQVVPADRLLVFEVSQGWGPLCNFLGKPVLQQPFPHIKDREEWRQRLQHMRRLNAALTYGIPAVAVALAAAGVALGHRWLQRS
ncbi:hypothetical protein OEZ86_013547 [Tetradesmus obliquus]|nr:hypothetical protein OEZ86_013547 [Tetradesmus obliquus]